MDAQNKEKEVQANKNTTTNEITNSTSEQLADNETNIEEIHK